MRQGSLRRNKAVVLRQSPYGDAQILHISDESRHEREAFLRTVNKLLARMRKDGFVSSKRQ
jgi:hypothetical protein